MSNQSMLWLYLTTSDKKRVWPPRTVLHDTLWPAHDRRASAHVYMYTFGTSEHNYIFIYIHIYMRYSIGVYGPSTCISACT